MELGQGWSESRLVFSGRNGRMWHGAELNQSLRRLCKRIDLPFIGVHGIRHTGGSLAYADRWPTKLISERMGHESAAFTESLYLHTDAAQHRDLAERMGELLG